MPFRSPYRQIAAMCAAMALFVVNDSLVKLAAANWPPHQIIAVRGVFALALLGGLAAAAGELSAWRVLLRPIMLLRCLIEAFIAIGYITALAALPIADVTAVLLVSPLLITVAGAVIFRERTGWRRWLAVVAGFAGMLLVVRPAGEAFGFAGLLALLSTIGVAARDLLTRRLPDDVPSRLVALASTVAILALGCLMSLAMGWRPIEVAPLGFTVAAAVTVAVGNLMIVVAFRNVDVSVVSPYRYTVILWAIVAGYAVFGEEPSPAGWLGIALIVGSGLFTLYRESTLALKHDKNA
jgi:drug/metabolite transporter (DMT)-like permease